MFSEIKKEIAVLQADKVRRIECAYIVLSTFFFARLVWYF